MSLRLEMDTPTLETVEPAELKEVDGKLCYVVTFRWKTWLRAVDEPDPLPRRDSEEAPRT